MVESQRPSSPDVLALFQETLARLARGTGLAAGTAPALWWRFAAYYEHLASLPRRTRRRLQRRWRESLGGLALLLALGQAPALAADITVDTDIPDVLVDGNCSLIEAIENANLDAAGPHIDCLPGSGPDTIILPANSTHTLTASNNDSYGRSGLPVITSAVTIEGNGSVITRADNPEAPFRILTVGSTGNLTLNTTTVSGGEARLVGPSNLGGGVYNLGTLSLSGSRVSVNTARSGAGVFNAGNATLILTNSTISFNSAASNGGGVQIRTGSTVSLMESTVSGNSAGLDGGGFDTDGTVTVINSTISGNSVTRREQSSDGGGVNNTGLLNIVNSTVSGNSAFSFGGGLFNVGTMSITTSTVSGNAAGNLGGGVFNFGRLTITRTLISGNTALTGPEAYNGSSGAVTTGNFNLFGHDGGPGVIGFPLGPTDLVSNVALNGILIPRLLRLGGPTSTLALVAGSPAVDAVPVASCTETLDQRGAPRRQDGDGDTVAECDIGAFELGQMPVQAELVGDTFRCITPTKTCRVTIQCNLTEARCTNDIVVTVRRRPRRNSNGTVTKASSRIPFARSSVTNVPPGEAQEVILRLTRPGRRLAEGQRRLRGRLEIMEIAATVSNTPPLTISRTPVTIRLRRR